jgi:glycogen debranching enzyme
MPDASARRPPDGPGPEVLAGPGTVTAISGLTFVISDELGDIRPGPFGLMARDTRHLSCLEVQVNGARLLHLGAGLLRPQTAQFRGYAPVPGPTPDAPLESERVREVGPDGFDEELRLTWWAPGETQVEVEVALGVDFADIFEVRRMPGPTDRPSEPRRVSAGGGDVRFVGADGDRGTRVRLRPPPDRIEEGRFRWTARVRRGGPWRLAMSVRATSAQAFVPTGPLLGPSSHLEPVTEVATEPERLATGCRRSLGDLERLCMPDTLDPSRRLLAAGIPWFVALFGRDALISSYQARAFQPRLMLDTLGALAARQGRVDDAGNEEQPGKILHEVRLTDRPWLGEGTTGGARPYYGSIDATPLFLVLLGEAWRWGAPASAVRELLPAARAAADWMRGPGDLDGDGFLEYGRRGGRSLVNQGWKDSENAIQFPDGRLADGPIALVEVQAYAYRARRDLAAVLAWLGEEAEADELDREADALRAHLRERFWRPGRNGRPGFFALALDGGKTPVDAVASNMAHLLWCGVPSNEEGEQVAAHLLGEGLASGWGLRTLSAEMAGFNPISYHVGSVWPHDTALACEGLRRYGFDREAMRLVGDLTDALALFDDRLPELFGGHAREDSEFPVPYPTACRPQAWAAGVPLAFVPLVLGLEPHVPSRTLSLNPALPPGLESLDVRGIPFPSGRLSVRVDGNGLRLIEAPPGLRVEVQPREGRALGGQSSIGGAEEYSSSVTGSPHAAGLPSSPTS